MLRTQTISPRLEAAYNYLRRGWVAIALCPPDHKNCHSSHLETCTSPGKSPLLSKDWPNRSFTAEQLRAVWTTNPTANVGVVLGPVSGLCAIDIDGEAGWETWQGLCREWGDGEPLDTVQFKTGNGHRLLFALPDGWDPPQRQWRNENGKECVRFQARGGQTVMPPSIHKGGGEYEWVEGCRPGEAPLADCPLWLHYLVSEAKPAQAPPVAVPDRPGTPVESRARAYLQKCDPAVSGSNGHGQAFKVACKLVHGFGLDDDTALALLLECWNPGCQPPWSEKELRHKVDSARKNGNSNDLLSVPRRNDLPPEPPLPSREQAPEGDDEQDATAEDLARLGSSVEWLWEGWIQKSVLACFAAEPGCGKTRFCADLTRRLYHGLPMPDGSAANAEPGARVLWLAADSQFAELCVLPDQFGFPQSAIVLNAPRSNPYTGTMLDTDEDRRDLERRILRVKPAVVFIDTCLNATDKGCTKPEDAKGFFKPLAEIAQRTRTAIVCVTHLNAAGKPLGKRIEGQVRTVFQLDKPDPEQPDRRKLYVVKTFDRFPKELGVTMMGTGNDYDSTPPQKAEEPGAGGTTRRKGEATREAADWLLANLPGRVFVLRKEWEQAGHSAATIYKAKEELGVIEDEIDGKKHWSMPTS